MSSVERVQWFRASAEKTRVDEEVNKLHAEFRRTILAWNNMAAAWASTSLLRHVSKGATAYANKKAAMYKRMAEDCEKVYVSSRRDPDGSKLDYSVHSSI